MRVKELNVKHTSVETAIVLSERSKRNLNVLCLISSATTVRMEHFNANKVVP